MHVSIVNTYACKQATPTSKKVSANTTASGTTEAIESTPPKVSMLHANPLRIFNNVCPAIIFAKSRTPSEMPRKAYEINSITTRKGESASGAPGGRKKLK